MKHSFKLPKPFTHIRKLRKAKLVKKSMDFTIKTLELPIDEIYNNSNIELISNRKAVFEGICGICEYELDYIKINIGKGMIELYGKNFTIKNLEEKSLIVEGTISRLEFLK